MVAMTFFPSVIIKESKGTLFISTTSDIPLSGQFVPHKNGGSAPTIIVEGYSYCCSHPSFLFFYVMFNFKLSVIYFPCVNFFYMVSRSFSLYRLFFNLTPFYSVIVYLS